MVLSPTVSLPLELWAMVLAHRRHDRRTLAACASVSRRFAALAQPDLFRTISVRSARQCAELLALVAHNPALLDSTMHASIEGNFVVAKNEVSWVTRERFAALSACLRAAQSIKLAYISLADLLSPDSDSDNDQAERTWSATQLRLVSCSLGSKPARVLDIRRAFPAVRDFRVVDCAWASKRPSAELPPSPALGGPANLPPSHPPLTRLALSTRRCAAELVPWLVLSGALRGVEALSFALDSAESAGALLVLCRAAGPALRTLQISVHTSQIDAFLGGGVLADTVSQLGPDINPHLEHLVVLWDHTGHLVAFNPVFWLPDLIDRISSHPRSELDTLTVPCPPMRSPSTSHSDAFAALKPALLRAAQGQTLSRIEFAVPQTRRARWRETVEQYMPNVSKSGIRITDVLRANFDPDS